MNGMTELKVTGMTCGHCESAVGKALVAVPGVTRVVECRSARRRTCPRRQLQAQHRHRAAGPRRHHPTPLVPLPRLAGEVRGRRLGQRVRRERHRVRDAHLRLLRADSVGPLRLSASRATVFRRCPHRLAGSSRWTIIAKSPSARIWTTSSRGDNASGTATWCMVHLLGPGQRAGHGDHTGAHGRGRQGLLGGDTTAKGLRDRGCSRVVLLARGRAGLRGLDRSARRCQSAVPHAEESG